MHSMFNLVGSSADPVLPVPYSKEDVLQEIVAKNPDLLILPSDPYDYKLFFVARELILPSSSGSALRVDVVFVDSQAVPVIVEVKRSSDSRIHNEIMSQVMDYASHLNLCNFDALVSNLCKNNAEDNTDNMTFNSDFISRLRSNINSGIMKLIIVADSIPKTLARTILFTNGQTHNILMYGVEISQYHVNGEHILSRSFVVSDQYLRPEKPANRSTHWTYDSLIERFRECGNSNAIDNLNASIRLTSALGIEIVYGSGSLNPTVSFNSKDIQLFTECFSFKGQGGGVVYINHKNIVRYSNAKFKSSDSIVDYLVAHGFEQDTLKVGINSTTFYLRLLNVESNIRSFASFLTDVVKNILT